MDEMRLRLRNILIIICETNWDARLAEGPRDDRSSAYAEESTLYMLEKISSLYGIGSLCTPSFQHYRVQGKGSLHFCVKDLKEVSELTCHFIISFVIR